MNVRKVANGIFWVSIPEIDYNILCGCPADSVKHLKLKGFIYKKERNGTAFESGPQAILLSDVSIQKGQFSNLAEFPVLQMFYLQGKIIPNHPNNDGTKPVLVGLENQVKATSEYIYRGNYGLLTMEEMLAAGVDEETAGKLLRLKKKFAFNTFRRTEELLDSHFLDNKEKPGTVVLENGIKFKRQGLNRFTISYGGTSCDVDLNLQHREEYESPYRLEFTRIEREKFSIIHTGEGNGWDVLRPCMASILIFKGKIYLIDAGPSIVYSLRALGISPSEIAGIFHTHSHDDHFAGMTSLIRTDHPLNYYTTSLVRHSVTKKMAALMGVSEDRFSVYFRYHDLEEGKWNDINGLEVKPVFSPHPVDTNIFFFRGRCENGYKTYAHLADITSFAVMDTMVTDDDSESGISPEYCEEVKRMYLETVDLKKIDVGGGQIHGEAGDFGMDASKKILFSHTLGGLTEEEKELGSNTYFGDADILIPASETFKDTFIVDYLKTYFPDISEEDLNELICCEVKECNAGELLLRRGRFHDNVDLIITGLGEAINSETGFKRKLSSGSMIGELACLDNETAKETYRADSALKLLRIPVDTYRSFVKKHNLEDSLREMLLRRRFLLESWLFGEFISSSVLNKVARSMKLELVEGGTVFKTARNNAHLYLILEGSAKIRSDGFDIEEISVGDFYGEDKLLIRAEHDLELASLTGLKVYAIPAESLKEIPVVELKMLEVFERRVRSLANPNT